MVSFEGRRILSTTARILALAAVAEPYAGFSQRAFEPLADEGQRQIVEAIREEQEAGGPNSADLIDPLTSLALLYQERGEHGLAAAALERAQQVVRVNYGLHSLAQAPLLEQLIRSEEARGNHPVVWALEQDLLALARQNPDDLRTVPVLRGIADRRMDVLRRYLAGEFPPQVILGCYYASGATGNCFSAATSGSRNDVIRAIVAEAQTYYSRAIGIFLQHEIHSSDELRELEMELVRSSYRYGTYALGRDSLRRLLAYAVASAEPPLTQIDALIQIADWAALFAPSNEPALVLYKQAYGQLELHGIAEALVEQRFSPKTPVVVPTFLPNPLVSDETEESTGFIDVAFEVTKYGRGRRIRVLDTTTNATHAAKERLVHLISGSQFRPRVIDGQFVDSSRITVRYFLNEE